MRRPGRPGEQLQWQSLLASRALTLTSCTLALHHCWAPLTALTHSARECCLPAFASHLNVVGTHKCVCRIGEHCQAQSSRMLGSS